MSASNNYSATHNNNNLTSGNNGPLEKDFENGNGYHLDSSMDPDTALKKIQTSGSLSISPELFEKIYLSPQNRVAGDLRKTFGNPTPLALCGFLLSLTPLSCMLMGWRGAGAGGVVSADTGVYIFFGGLLMVLGGIGEWIIGNTFPFVVFTSFGAFWFAFGATQQPFYAAWANYAAQSSTPNNPAGGLTTTGFNASFAFFLLFMGLLCLLYLVCALRTNVVFLLIFTTLVPAFGCLAAAYWLIPGGAPNLAIIHRLLVTAGALTFVTDALGWWIFLAIMLAALDFPFQLPVGDLSHLIRGASEKAKMKEEHSA